MYTSSYVVRSKTCSGLYEHTLVEEKHKVYVQQKMQQQLRIRTTNASATSRCSYLQTLKVQQRFEVIAAGWRACWHVVCEAAPVSPCGDSEANPKLKIAPQFFCFTTTVSPSLNPVRYGAVKFLNVETL